MRPSTLVRHTLKSRILGMAIFLKFVKKRNKELYTFLNSFIKVLHLSLMHIGQPASRMVPLVTISISVTGFHEQLSLVQHFSKSSKKTQDFLEVYFFNFVALDSKVLNCFKSFKKCTFQRKLYAFFWASSKVRKRLNCK